MDLKETTNELGWFFLFDICQESLEDHLEDRRILEEDLYRSSHHQKTLNEVCGRDICEENNRPLSIFIKIMSLSFSKRSNERSWVGIPIMYGTGAYKN